MRFYLQIENLLVQTRWLLPTPSPVRGQSIDAIQLRGLKSPSQAPRAVFNPLPECSTSFADISGGILLRAQLRYLNMQTQNVWRLGGMMSGYGGSEREGSG